MVELTIEKKSHRLALLKLVQVGLIFSSSLALANTSLGQNGSALRAIGGTGVSVSAIGGTGVQKSARAIGGTGVSVSAIGGTGVQKSARAIGGTGKVAVAGIGQLQVMVMGPIDAIDSVNGTLSVLGRTLQLPTMGSAAESIVAAYTGGSPLQVAVLGSLSENGKFQRVGLHVLSSPYVAGVSEVAVTGAVKALNSATGQAKVGDVIVDYGALLNTEATAMRVGDIVTVRGTMPQMGQAILAAVLVIHGR